MAEAKRVRILIVDDQPESISGHFLDAAAADLDIRISHPIDVYDTDLRDVRLVLVDYEIEHWPDQDALPLCARPADGVAIASVLRSQIARDIPPHPIAFALHAARLDILAGGLLAASREHVIARTHNLEWAFRKTADESGPARISQLRSLAHAIDQLPEAWPKQRPTELRELSSALLNLPVGVAWAYRAWDDVEDCYPPIHEIASATQGMSFLRWLLHRVLPYPSFLRDEIYLALQLRVTVSSLRAALASGAGPLLDALAPAAYRGILDEFLGRRWWKAGIDALLWELTDGRPLERGAVAAAVRNVSPNLEPLELRNPIVCVSEQFRPTDSFIEREGAVEIRPDDWPGYADRPWISLELARSEPAFASLVVSEDRDLLSAPSMEPTEEEGA